LGLLLGLLLVLFVFSVKESQKPKLVFCDVGQGDGMLLTQGNFQAVVDVGPKNKKMVECLGSHMPFWDKTIDIVTISHWDDDHAGGLAEVSRYYKINKLVAGNLSKAKNEQFNSAEVVREGDEIRSGEMVIEVLSSSGLEGKGGDEENGGSLVTLLSYRNKKYLLMGDATETVEQKLVWRGILKARLGEGGMEVLKVGHHGSATATTEELLKSVKAKMALVSVGRKNRFGHPAKEVLERLEKYGVNIWRTDEKGELVISL
jgi:competence protein ComEC